MHGDGAGLYLRVASGGSRQWIQRITIDGKRRDLGLGGFPAVSLARARQVAHANRSTVAEGRDPLAEKRRAKLPTFGEAARKVHEANLPRWRNGKHTANWMTTLVRHALPVIGDMPVDRIGREDVLRVLTPIWTAKPETARRVRQRIRAVLRWCQAHGFVEFNMAGEVIDGALPLTSKMKAHFRALPYREVTGLLATVEASRGIAEHVKAVSSVLDPRTCVHESVARRGVATWVRDRFGCRSDRRESGVGKPAIHSGGHRGSGLGLG